MRIVIAVTGASGAIYAKVLLNELQKLLSESAIIALVMTDTAKEIWKAELKEESYKDMPWKRYHEDDFYAPFASGSNVYDATIVIPCSMGTLGRIAHGSADNLITRAADVALKERKKLILVTRETPLNLIQIGNMKTITEAGGIICPANPSFYSGPANIEALVSTVTDRVLNLAGIPNNGYQWGSNRTK